MKKRMFSLILMSAVSAGFCGESKLLNGIGKFLPNFTEIAFVTNTVNVYLQVSGFVRETNKLLKSVKATQQQWNMMTAQINEMYGTIKSLRDIDLYDMDTWSQTLEQGEILLRHDVSDLLQSFNMLEYYSLGASERYMKSIQSLSDYKLSMNSRKSSTRNLFLTNDYRNAIDQFSETLDIYKGTTREILDAMLASERQIYMNETDPQKKADSQRRVEELQRQIEELDLSFSRQVYSTKIDTIMEEASIMIAANLTEVQLAAQKIKEMQDNAMSLVESYERLKKGNISTNKKENILTSDPAIDLNRYDSDDPDKVPVPQTPSGIKPKETRKKIAGNEDVKNMANAIDLLLLRQEALMRDIEILKCNTMAFILAIEAYKQNAIEQDVFIMAHGGKLVEKGISR
jgi:phage FluMu protein gp41